MPVADVNHSILSMFLAEGRRPAGFGVKVWLPRAGVM